MPGARPSRTASLYRERYRGRETRLVAASREGGGVSFRSSGESTEIESLLSGGPNGIVSVDNILAQGEKTFVQHWHCVSTLEYPVKLRDLRGGPVAKTDSMSIYLK